MVELAAAPPPPAAAAVPETGPTPPGEDDPLAPDDQTDLAQNDGTDPLFSVQDQIDAALTAAQVRYVTASRVNVRSGPSTDYDVVGRASFGEALELLDEPVDGWVRVRLPIDLIEGYISEQFLSEAQPNG